MAYPVRKGAPNPAAHWFAVDEKHMPETSVFDPMQRMKEEDAEALLRGCLVRRVGGGGRKGSALVRGLVVADAQPGDEEVGVRFGGTVHAEMCRVEDLIVCRDRREAYDDLKAVALELHEVICAAECFANCKPEDATLEKVRSGGAPPIWREQDATTRVDVDWVGHVARKCIAYRNLVCSDAMNECVWRSLEGVVLDTAARLFGEASPEVVAILLVQVFAFEALYNLPDDGQARYARAARDKCDRLRAIATDPKTPFAEGLVELPWCEGDASMRYDDTLLEAEAVQHLASVIAASGDNDTALEKYYEAIALGEKAGKRGEAKLVACHHDCAGLYGTLALGAPGSQLRRLREAAELAPTPDRGAKLNVALRHATTALRLAERTFGRVNTATGQMHFAVGKLCMDSKLWHDATHHLSQACLLQHLVYCGHLGHGDHVEVRRCVEAMQQCILDYKINDIKAIDVAPDVEDALDADSSRVRCSNPLCDRVEADADRFDRCAKCKCTKYCSRDCQRAHWADHKKACKACVPMAEQVADLKAKEPLVHPAPFGVVARARAETARARKADRDAAKQARGLAPEADAEPPADDDDMQTRD